MFDLFKIAKHKAMPGHYISTHYSISDKNPKVVEFLKKVNEQQAKIPANDRKGSSSFTALGYDAVYVAYNALIKADSVEPEKLKKAIAETKNFDGVTGKISLDSHRNAVKPVVIVQSTETDFSKFVTRIDP